jgi:hypothetical protein
MPDRTLADFFRRHDAVPAADSGPCWGRAGEQCLLAWFGRLAAVVRCGWDADRGRDATAAEREARRPLYEAVAAEVTRRAAAPGASPAILAAAIRAAPPPCR